jgi:hypothetical protein
LVRKINFYLCFWLNSTFKRKKTSTYKALEKRKHFENYNKIIQVSEKSSITAHSWKLMCIFALSLNRLMKKVKYRQTINGVHLDSMVSLMWHQILFKSLITIWYLKNQLFICMTYYFLISHFISLIERHVFNVKVYLKIFEQILDNLLFKSLLL